MKTRTVTPTKEAERVVRTEIEDERVLVFDPVGREAELTCGALAQAGVSALSCRDADALHKELKSGAGAAFLREAALTSETLEVLTAALSAQPPWSDLPLLVCLNPDTTAAARTRTTETLLSSWRVFVLEAPVQPVTLVRAVRSALKARRRQYQVRDLLTRLETHNDRLGEGVQERTVALHHSEARFSKVFYASPVPVTITTLDEGRYIDVNESALTLLGYERDEVIGRTASELSRWLPETRGTRDELLHKVQEAGSLHDVAVKFHTKTGELRNGLATLEVLELGGELCLLSMLLDVTERKQNEEELMQAVQEVMSDTDWFSRSFVEKLAQVRTKGTTDHQAELKELTPRETQVLERVARGNSNKRIAAELNLSENTVRNYLASVFAKLNLHTRAEAVVWARQRGLGRGG